MPDYYLLEIDGRLRDVVKVKGIDKVVDIKSVRKNQIQFLNSDPVMLYVDSGMYPGFIDASVILVSDEVKTILDKINIKNIFYKCICLGNVEKMTQMIYWLIVPRKVDCVSKNAEFNRDGSLKRLELDREKIGKALVFKIEGIFEDLIVFHKEVIKSIDMRDLGVVFTPVDVC